MNINKQIGLFHENIAAKYLKNNGYKIIKQNYLSKVGEIDIIAQDKNDLVFVEVKYRKSSQAGTPVEAVNISKQKKIIKTALIYIQENKIKDNFRFDVVSIDNEKIEIIKSAFDIQSGKYYF